MNSFFPIINKLIKNPKEGLEVSLSSSMYAQCSRGSGFNPQHIKQTNKKD